MTCNVAQGWSSYIGFGTQTVNQFTAADPTIFQEFNADESMQEVEPDKAAVAGGIRYSQNKVTVRRGKKSVEGSSGTGFLYPNDYYFAKIYAAILGNNQTVSGDATTGYTHTFNEPTTKAQFPQYGETIEVLRGAEATVGVANENLFKYIGCFANTVTLTLPENDNVSLAAEWIGIKEEYNATPNVTPTFSEVPQIESWQAVIKIGNTLGTATQIKYSDATFSINKNVVLTPDGSSQYPDCAVFDKPDYTIQLNQITTDLIASGLYGAWKNNTDQAMIIELTSDSLAGTSSGNYKVTINIPRVTLLGDTPNVSGTQQFMTPVRFQALEDATEGYTVQIQVVDAVAGTYDV
jgi:hypothetical protein